METDRLRHFKVLVETGNMRKAAELLALSHGGLSKSIRKLEDELGTKLTRPDGRGLAITDEGKRVYERATQFLSAEKVFRDAHAQMGKTEENLRIGTFEVFSTYFMGRLVADKNVPSPLRLREYVPGKMEAAIVAREIDVGITYLPIPHPELAFHKIASIEMGIYVNRGSFPKIPVEKLPFVVPVTPVEGSPSGVKGLDGWPDHLFPRQVRFEVELMQSGIELCRRGLCAIFIPDFIANLHNESVSAEYSLQKRSYPASVRPVHREVFLVTLKDRRANAFAKNLGRTLAALK